jgi:hypothetical protein
MLAAALEWIKLYGTDELYFSVPPLECLLLAPLTRSTIPLLADTSMAVLFLIRLDLRTGHEGTCAQACFVIRHLGLPFEEWSAEKMHDSLKLLTKGGTS